MGWFNLSTYGSELEPTPSLSGGEIFSQVPGSLCNCDCYDSTLLVITGALARSTRVTFATLAAAHIPNSCHWARSDPVVHPRKIVPLRATREH